MRQKRLESFADFVCCEPGFLGPGHTIFQSIGPEVLAHPKNHTTGHQKVQLKDLSEDP